MKSSLVAREYARVLARFAEAEYPGLRSFLRSLDTAMRAEPSIRHFLNHPAIAKDEKVRCLLKAASGTPPPIMERVFLDLITRGATGLFGAIADEMDRFDAEKHNIRTVEVESAWPLASTEQEALTAKLSSYVGGKVTVSYAVNDGLISGMQIKIGDTIIDNTLKTDLEHIRQELMAASLT